MVHCTPVTRDDLVQCTPVDMDPTAQRDLVQCNPMIGDKLVNCAPGSRKDFFITREMGNGTDVVIFGSNGNVG